MKLGTFTNITTKEDIQIQTAISRLLVHVQIPNGVDPADLKLRIRVFGSKGYQPLIERTAALDLFEICAAREGFYTRQDVLDGGGVNIGQLIRGQIEIGVMGSLVMPAGAYLSLDVISPFVIPTMSLWAIAGGITTNKYHRYTPATIQDTLKDIPMAGVDSLVFNPAKIKSIKFQYPDQGTDYDVEELEAIGCNINDLVWVNRSANTVVCGYDRLIEMNTEKASRVTIEPKESGQFNVLLISAETLL